MCDDRRFQYFLSWAGAMLVAGIVAATGFVAIVDPYRLYQWVDVDGFNHVKPTLTRYQEEIKLSQARKAGANVIFLGNSRVEYGMNPAGLGSPSPGWDGGKKDIAYNLAISGTAIATARDELAYLDAIGQAPKKVVLGLDFLDFLVDPLQMSLKPPQPPLPFQHPAFKVDGIAWKIDTLFSLASVMDAWTTLRIQRQPDAETMAPNGSNPLLEYNKYARDEGYFAIFQQRALEYADTFVRRPHGLHYTLTNSSPALDDLRAIIAIAVKDGIELHMLVYPYHAQMTAMFESSGLSPAFEQWKDLMVDEAANAIWQKPGARISLWDFSGFSTMQCEPIPAKNDRTSVTQWYWEAGHFKQNVGDIILARMHDANLATPPGAAHFGMALTPANLEENRQRVARERAACVAAEPQLFADAAQLIQNARSRLQAR